MHSFGVWLNTQMFDYLQVLVHVCFVSGNEIRERMDNREMSRVWLINVQKTALSFKTKRTYSMPIL